MHNVETIPALLHMDSHHRLLSVLPVWHILERTSEYLALCVGASIWYTTRLTFARDLGMVAPTHVVSVPRIWVLLYDGVMASIRQQGKEALFSKLYGHSLKVIAARRYRQRRQYLVAGEEPTRCPVSLIDRLCHKAADRLIYRKIRARLGPNFEASISGGGSLPEYIDDFFEAIGVTLLEGYGLTETSPVLCVRTFEHRIPYTVGRPLPGTEIRILDEAEQPVEDGKQGIVWVCGPQVMDGYRKNPEETAKVMRRHADGRTWFNTGDLGRRTRDGDISITGRVKDTIVLLGGENVEPGRIESTLMRSDRISQVMVCGQDQEYLTALIVPDEDKLRETCEAVGIDFDARTLPELLKDDTIHKVYMDDICDRISEATGFREVELIHDLAFVRPFVSEDGTLTQTLKVKRRSVRERDAETIKAMYPRYREAGHIKGGAS
jgi:long-chain acyl-CoA synthetase